MKNLRRDLAVVALLGLLFAGRSAFGQAGGWRRVGDMSAARVGPAVAALASGAVLVAGGSGLATAETYDSARGQFVLTGSMSTGRSYATATLLFDGTVLVAGGAGSSGSLDTAEIYDPNKGRFTLLGSRMSSAREQHTATLLPSGDVLLVGGYNSRSGTLANTEIYNPGTRTFRVTGSLSLSRRGHAATCLPGDGESPAGYVLVVGGAHTYEGQLVPQSTAELYSLATSAFSPAGLMSAARDHPTVTYVPTLGQALIVGGRGRSGSTEAQTSEFYDLENRAFTAGPPLDADRASHQAVTLNDGNLLIIAGFSDSHAGAVDSAEIYGPGGEFATEAHLAQGRQEFGAARLATGQVLVVGGRGSGNSLRSAELYTP
jgi:Galactose oxidase, central domain